MLASKFRFSNNNLVCVIKSYLRGNKKCSVKLKKKLNLPTMRIALLHSVNGKISMSLQLTSFSLKDLSGYVDPSCRTVINASISRSLVSHQADYFYSYNLGIKLLKFLFPSTVGSRFTTRLRSRIFGSKSNLRRTSTI